MDNKNLRQKVLCLQEEYHKIVWGGYKYAIDDFVAILYGEDRFKKAWATGRLLLYASWTVAIKILGIDEIVSRWEMVKEVYRRNQYTEQMFKNMEWVVPYVESRRKRSALQNAG
jgi:hypothetical protein